MFFAAVFHLVGVCFVVVGVSMRMLRTAVRLARARPFGGGDAGGVFGRSSGRERESRSMTGHFLKSFHEINV